LKKYILQHNPAIIPVPGNKTISEHFGLVSTRESNYSIAHMVAPPGWSEPFQQPDFDEITFMIEGKKEIIIEDEIIILEKGQSILIKKGTLLRYSNPFDEPAEYLSICIPAFSIETVNRRSK
jgi:ethanolamine utilization protein EutQ